ncbi:WhiB family transcriptional regulator [Haloechinothrix sp. YIM 98757]|uniref:Transcriptional regulator WhiB n=1 Tax=Haloechinothrix aidingensis TaxID=2752311 RepID=A0A838AAR4_9PSEU|nr:WhiB family transcriptional regulator [Haloechinothrix aidingensis]
MTDTWRNKALCRQYDPEIFFPFTGDAELPKRVCGSCPVRERCLRYALDTGQRYGVWGGLTEDERRQLPHPSRPDPAVSDTFEAHIAELMDRGITPGESAAYLMRPEPEVRRIRDRIQKRRSRARSEGVG